MELSELLGRDGPLARQIPGFALRPQQIRLAEAVADTLERRGVLIAEAGTGTGKTFAYLVPALASGRKVIVSTGTRALQDQLFHKDLPLVRRALGVPVRVALLKGRGNYLCRQRLALTEAAGRFPSRQQAAEFARIRDWAGRTERGDIAEVPGIPETSPLWARVTSSADNCLGQDCPHFEQCHVLRARREAQEADLLVINHHLFCADMAIREEGFAELLPGADAFILDEAHQLPEVAGQFFGLTLSSRQLIELARDSLAEQLRDAAEFQALAEHAQRLEQACAVLRLALGEEDSRRAAWHEVAELPAVVEALSGLDETLDGLRLALKEAAPRGKGLENCWSRCEALLERLRQLGGDPGDGNVHWFETQGRGFSLSLTPLDLAPLLRERMARYQAAWVFTSATLAIGDDFRHFAASLGLKEAQTLQLESPFDYARNALLYHPEGLPDPAAPHYGAAVVEAVLPVLEASRGRAFLLFTSHQALQEAAERLKGRTPYPLLVQGELPKGELLGRFRALGNAVLLGTASFWEGVDVRGEALSCVVIAKLPFSSPGDPLEQARIEALRRQGGNSFLQYQVPQAVIALKQGAGRLIRDVSDRGVLMLCDPRILTKPYGRLFLDSLPPMTRTRKLERVRRFFALADIR